MSFPAGDRVLSQETWEGKQNAGCISPLPLIWLVHFGGTEKVPSFQAAQRGLVCTLLDVKKKIVKVVNFMLYDFCHNKNI